MRAHATCTLLGLLLTTGALAADDERGVLLGLGLQAGALERDGYAVLTPTVGYLSPWLDVELGLPLELLVLDLDPADRERAVAGVLRARGLAPGGELTPAAFSQVLRRARLGRPGDPVQLRAGQIQHSLGHGGAMWRFLSTPDVDRRHAGLVLRVGETRLGVEGVVGDALAPHQVSGARLWVRPLAWLDDDASAGPGQRLVLGAGYAADFFAPVDPRAIAGDGSYRAAGATASIVHGGLDLEAELIALETWTLATYADTSLRRSQGNAFGLGGEAGLQSALQLWSAHLRLRAGLRLSSAHHRAGEFDAFYQIERVTSFVDGRPKALQPAVAGLGGVLELEFELARAFHLHLAIDDVAGPDNSNLWLGAELDLGPLHAGLGLAQRAFEGPLGWLRWNARSVALCEARVEVLGPLAVVGRYWRTLRLDAARVPRLDDDLLLGIEVGWLLQ